VVYFKVALMLGAILASPIITYHLFMFIIPGLTKKEKRWVLLALPGTTLLFFIGLAFTWSFLLPAYVTFLSNFQSSIFQTIWTAEAYISFVTSVLFWHAAAFETPLIFYVLARGGFVTSSQMTQYWRQAIVGSAVVAALITPTVDPITMGVITGILMVLYVFSILLVAIAQRLSPINR
jgi:sec-independent protein translocase protein TatC